MHERASSALSTAFLASVALSLFACSSEPSAGDTEDSGVFNDAGDADSPRDRGSFVSVETSDPNDVGLCDEAPNNAGAAHDFCPGASCGECAFERPPLELIAKASDLGQGVRFVTMRGELVLAEAANGEPLIYELSAKESGLPIVLTAMPFEPPPPAKLRGRAVAGFFHSLRQGGAVLCDDESCTAYGFRDTGDRWVAEPLAAKLPVDAQGVVGAFVHWEAEIPSLCVYGDGIHCLNEDRSSFRTLATGEGGKLLAVDNLGAWLVGENGRVVRLERDGAVEPYHGIEARLHAVESEGLGKSAWAAGEGGTLLALGESGPRICNTKKHDIQVVAGDYADFIGWIDASGTWLEAPVAARKRWCSWRPPMDDVLAIAIRPCGLVLNRWLLSPEELRGELRCMYD